MNGPGGANKRAKRTLPLAALAFLAAVAAGPVAGETLPDTANPERQAAVPEENLELQAQSGASQEIVPVFSLQQILETALQRNPAIASADELSRAHEARYKQERGAYFPQLDATVQFHRYWMDLADWATMFGSVYTFPADENFPAATITVSQYLYDFGKVPGQVGSSRHRYRASQKARLETVTSVVLEAQQAFYEVLKRQGYVDVEEKSVEIYAEHLQRAQDYVEAGVRPEIDATRARVALSKAQRLLLTARYETRLALIDLERVTGGPLAGGSYKLAGISDFVPERAEAEGLLVRAQEQRPEIARVREEIEAARASTQSAWAGYFPSIRADATFDWEDADISFYNHAWIVGVRMDWNIFSGLRTYEAVKEGKAVQQSLRSRLRQEELQVIQEVSQAATRVNESVDDIRTSTTVLEEARQNMELARSRYNNGLGDYLEFSDAELSWRTAGYDLVKARYGYLQNRAALDYATGRTAARMQLEPASVEPSSPDAGQEVSAAVDGRRGEALAARR